MLNGALLNAHCDVATPDMMEANLRDGLHDLLYCYEPSRCDAIPCRHAACRDRPEAERDAFNDTTNLDRSQRSPMPKDNYLQPTILFVMGLFLASSPVIQAPLTPGYRSLCTLLSWLPSSGDFLGYPGSLLQCLGGILITWSVANSAPSSFIASVFSNPVA